MSEGFTAAERTALRKYIVERGGMLFFDDCGFNGLFAQQVALELDKIFPEYPLKDIPHNHEVYKLYYQLPRPPRGGDVFGRLRARVRARKGLTQPSPPGSLTKKGYRLDED